MPLERADWTDILKVLRETYGIWSPGLPRDAYYHYISRQMAQPWARRNYRYFVLREAGEIVASAKLYTVPIQSRSAIYSFAGIGAVYTQEAYRNLGYGRKLLEALLALARQEERAGAFLFSDIGPALYEKFGFVAMGGRQFSVSIPASDDSDLDRPDMKALASLPVLVEPVQIAHMASLSLHHRRWLRRRPFGVARTMDYWAYKIGREIFLHDESRWSWPRLELVRHGFDPSESGYAIIEHAGLTLRVLEVIAPEPAEREIWRSLFALAIQRKARRVRGWEGVCPEIIRRPRFEERAWGVPMLLPFAKETADWPRVNPCPLLELDHL